MLTGFTSFLLVLIIVGGQTYVDYFSDWAKRTEVYDAFDGRVVDLTNQFLQLPPGQSVVIPFYFYKHASLRYLLHDRFKETIVLPEEVSAQLSDQPEIPLLIPEYPPRDDSPPSYVLLYVNEHGQGRAYVSAVNRLATLSAMTPDSFSIVYSDEGVSLAEQYLVDGDHLVNLFVPHLPRETAPVEWSNTLRLAGYEYSPSQVKPGKPVNLVLAWKLLNYTGINKKIFLQIFDQTGNPIGQQGTRPLFQKNVSLAGGWHNFGAGTR